MAKNSDLNKANAAKKDEFYTALDVVSAEMRYHRKFSKIKPFSVIAMIHSIVIFSSILP